MIRRGTTVQDESVGPDPHAHPAVTESFELEISKGVSVLHSKRDIVINAMSKVPKDAWRASDPAGQNGIRIRPKLVIGDTDDRTRIETTDAYPWRAICYLDITAGDGSKHLGTGWLAGDSTVITAGHCVFMHGHGGWVKRVRVHAGRNGTAEYAAPVSAKVFRSVSGWTNQAARKFDYGAILLPSKLGEQTGFFGFASIPDSKVRELKVNIAGYPDDKPPHGSLWWQARRVDDFDNMVLRYAIDTSGGQSGAPIWRSVNGQRQVIGIHGSGFSRSNQGVRITNTVFKNIKQWIRESV